MNPTPSQSQIMQALRAFLLAVLPDGTDVIAGQDNRVPEPQAPAFVVMTPIRFERLKTNIDGDADCKFTGSFGPGTTMVVTAVDGGEIAVGATVIGTGVAAGTTVVSQQSGPAGGAGNYTVSVAQTLSSRILSAGRQTLTQDSICVVQLDFHNEPTSAANAAGDMAQVVTTAFRDEYGAAFFAALDPPLDGIAPLYADDPRQMPFINAEQQYEWRWVLEARLEVQQTIVVPEPYADAATVTALSVEALFPS